jgi:hypothetical protein
MMEPMSVFQQIQQNQNIPVSPIQRLQRSASQDESHHSHHQPMARNGRIGFLRSHVIGIDPWKQAYAPLVAEFLASLVYTLFSLVCSFLYVNFIDLWYSANLLLTIGWKYPSQKFSIALLDGGVTMTLICMFGGISGAHFNPGIHRWMALSYPL